MNITSCAQIAKTYGKDGEILLRVESDRFSEMLEECEEEGKELEEPVFVYFDGLPVPFFISSAKHRSNNAWVVTFSTVRDLSHAEEIVGRDLYLEASEADVFNDLDLLVGFAVVDENGKPAGIVSKVVEYPSNICLEIRRQSGASDEEVLLPFHEDLVASFDQENRIIAMKIPAGLLD